MENLEPEIVVLDSFHLEVQTEIQSAFLQVCILFPGGP